MRFIRKFSLVAICLLMAFYIMPTDLYLSYAPSAIPLQHHSLSEFEIGQVVLLERGSSTYLGGSSWSYSTTLGEMNTSNGSHYVKYLYDAETHNATFAGHSLTLYDWYATFSNSTQTLIHDMRWIVETYSNRWRELDLWDHSFLEAKEGSVLQFGQRFTDGSSNLDVWYFVRNNDNVKILLNFTPAATALYRFVWQVTGISGDPQLNNKSITFNEVNIGFSDTELNATYVWEVATKKLDITFDNLTINAGETYTLDPSVNPTIGADANDNWWWLDLDAPSATNRAAYTENYNLYLAPDYCYYSQWRFALSIPQGSTIDNANLSLYQYYYNGASEHTATVWRIDETNVGDLEADTVLPARNNGTTDEFVFPVASGLRVYGNVTDVVQAQIDLVGWSSGYSMAFRLGYSATASGHRRHTDYQSGRSSEYAYLNVTYTEAGGNNAPSNDGATLTNPDDTDNLYAVYKEYIFTTNSSDSDGFADIDYIELSLYSGSAKWTCRYDEDTDTFSEQVGASYIVLGGSSNANEDTNDIDIEWYIEIDWTHGSIDNYDLRLYTVDDEPESDTDDYDLNYDVICEVDITTGPTLYDEAGTQDRGDYDTVGGIVANGTVDYYGSSISPASDEVDVWVICNDVASSPWSDLTLTDGTFSISVDSDDLIGLDTYTFKVVEESAGSGGSDLCYSSETDTYIADRMVFTITADGDTVVNGTQVNFTVTAIYDYDDSAFSWWNITVTNDGVFFGVFNYSSTNFNDTDESTTNVYSISAFTNETAHIITKFSVTTETVIWYPEGSPPTTTTNATSEINYIEEIFLAASFIGCFGPLLLITAGFIITTKFKPLGLVWYIVECLAAAYYLDLVETTPFYIWQAWILLLGGFVAWLGPMITQRK